MLDTVLSSMLEAEERRDTHSPRRRFLLSTAAFCWAGIACGGPHSENMYGLINKIVAVPKRRDDLIAILKESSNAMPGCLSYVIAEDASDENGIWITEIWDSEESHRGFVEPAGREGCDLEGETADRRIRQNCRYQASYRRPAGCPLRGSCVRT